MLGAHLVRNDEEFGRSGPEVGGKKASLASTPPQNTKESSSVGEGWERGGVELGTRKLTGGKTRGVCVGESFEVGFHGRGRVPSLIRRRDATGCVVFVGDVSMPVGKPHIKTSRDEQIGIH